MAESAALLVDEVFPEQPVRQWVLSFPYPLRFIRRFTPHPSGQLKLFNASLLSACQPAGDHGSGAWYCVSGHRHAPDQKGGLLVPDGPHRCRDVDPTLR